MDLSLYDNSWYNPGGSKFKRALWYFFNICFFKNTLFPFIKAKVFMLRWFGASVGENVVLKPAINIKYPWNLRIGNNVWIGEGVWIDNLSMVTIEDNVCISQGALLLCGNHDYKKKTFDLMLGEIYCESGVWIGAKAVVAPGVRLKTCAVLALGSVAVADLDAHGIYQGNPAVKVRERIIK